MRAIVTIGSVAVGVFLIDQMTKGWAAYAEMTTINRGISFGFVQESTVFVFLLVGCAVLSAAVIGRKVWLAQPIAAGLFWGGAVSNVYDRLHWGGVLDWMPVPFFSVTNNIADWAIAMGALLFVLSVLTRIPTGKEMNATR